MTSVSFEGLVRNGQLLHQESLRPLEGRQVFVTLIAPGAPAPPLPDGIEVETEVLVKMPRWAERLDDVVVVDKGAARPSPILPEEVADE